MRGFLLVCRTFTAVLGANTGAYAEPLAQSLPISSDSACPSSLAVEREVRELTTPERRGRLPADSAVAIRDRGASLSVSITSNGSTTGRAYDDPARDCERRRHFVAVLVVVSLMPPELATERARVAPPSPAPPKRTRPKLVRIELGGLSEWAAPVADSALASQFGGELCVALGRGNLRFTLATSYLPTAELRLKGARETRAELERLQLGLGLRLRWLTTPLDLGLDLGGLASRSELFGLTPHHPAQDTAFDVGARAGLRLALPERRLLAPFFGVQASLFPGARALAKLPDGTLGHLPYLWLGLSAGVALSL